MLVIIYVYIVLALTIRMAVAWFKCCEQQNKLFFKKAFVNILIFSY